MYTDTCKEYLNKIWKQQIKYILHNFSKVQYESEIT